MLQRELLDNAVLKTPQFGESNKCRPGLLLLVPKVDHGLLDGLSLGSIDSEGPGELKGYLSSGQ